MEDKYAVFKVEDVHWQPESDINPGMNPTLGQVIGDCLIDDAIVIRRQDLFAPPALDAYANNIRIATEVMPPSPHRTRLNELADYFHEQALLSWETDRKLPD